MSEELNQKKNLNPIIIILIIIIIALLLGGGYFAYMYMNAEPPETGIKNESNIFLNDHDAEQFLEDKVGSIGVNIYRIIYCERNEEGKLMGTVNAKNDNDFQIMIEFSLADTGEIIYTTALIPSGLGIEKIPVNIDLEPGTYSVNAIFTAVSDKDNQTSLGSTGLNIDMVVPKS